MLKMPGTPRGGQVDDRLESSHDLRGRITPSEKERGLGAAGN